MPGQTVQRVFRSIFQSAFLLICFKAFAFADAPSVPGQFLLKFSQSRQINVSSQNYIRSAMGVKVLKHHQLTDTDLVQVTGVDLSDSYTKAMIDQGVLEYVEPNYIFYTQATPNDANYSQLWGMNNTGQTGGTSDVDVDAPQAWDVTTGSNDVVVGVVDTGINYNHPDLQANIWTNTAEIAGNGLDDDANGVIDDIYGFNAISNGGDPNDDNGHGTHCAGTIGAVGNNSQGVVGVNWQLKLMALKFISAGGSGTLANAIEAIQYAISMKNRGVNLRVLSNSWGGGGFSLTLQNAISEANQAGILFVAAAGNSASNNDQNPAYPASYEVANVVSVAALDHKGDLASFSNYGAQSVDLAAPGVGILSTYLGQGYATLSGTSMAAPHVTGVAALLLSNEANLNIANLKSRLLDTIKPLSQLNGKMYAAGIVSASRALANTLPTVSLTSSAQNIAENSNAIFTANLSSVKSQAVTVNLAFSGTATIVDDYSITSSSITIPSGSLSSSVTLNAVDDSLAENNETVVVDVSSVSNATESGTQQRTVTILDNDQPVTPNITSPTNGVSFVTATPTIVGTAQAFKLVSVYIDNILNGTTTANSLGAWSYALSAALTEGSHTVRAVVDPNLSSETVSFSISFDSDNDGLTNSEEASRGTDPNNPDSDNDGGTDGQEVLDGSTATDRGSNLPVLSTTICSSWNGFLQNPGLAMWNIMEHVNLSDSTLQVRSTLYSNSGVAQSTVNFSVAPGAQYDLLVHGMKGWQLNSYGQVCSTLIGGNPGDLDGRMVFYKPTSNGRFEFAFAIPFSDGIRGSQFVPFNTFQPSLDSSDAKNLVANWIQITNHDIASQTGTVYFYQQNGSLLGQFVVNLAANGRQDFSAHQFGQSRVGLVEFKPNNNSAKFSMQNVRYYHDSSSFENIFAGAFELDGSVGNGQGISVPLDTVGSSSVLEVANTKNTSISVRVKVYDLNGLQKLNLSFALAAHASEHLIMDSVLVSQKGIAHITVDGKIPDSVIATAMQYGYDSSFGIKTLYGVSAKQALGATLSGTYNTWINQLCSLFIVNPTSSVQNANIKMVRLDGIIVVPGQSISIPANGGVLYDACLLDVSNTYGVITTTPNTPNSLYATVIRRGNLDDYRFPTLSRQ